jgi:hypothetical protein
VQQRATEPYRVIVVATDRTCINYTVQLDRAPLVGENLKLPNEEIVKVHAVSSGARYRIAGVIIAGPLVE